MSLPRCSPSSNVLSWRLGSSLYYGYGHLIFLRNGQVHLKPLNPYYFHSDYLLSFLLINILWSSAPWLDSFFSPQGSLLITSQWLSQPSQIDLPFWSINVLLSIALKTHDYALTSDIIGLW